jgi:hypothetical protein
MAAVTDDWLVASNNDMSRRIERRCANRIRQNLLHQIEVCALKKCEAVTNVSDRQKFLEYLIGKFNRIANHQSLVLHPFSARVGHEFLLGF